MLTADSNAQIGALVHEIGHALGFYHEHKRHDRDDFVFVIKNQIDSSLFNRAFKKKFPPYAAPIGNYDCRSTMHYIRRTKTKNGESITTFNGLPWACPQIGPRTQNRNGVQTWLSDQDIKAINDNY